MNYIVIYPGRFHPFHRGHLASYEYLTKKYGPENVYIATSDIQDPATSPFNYSDKVSMMTKLGIPASHIVQVRNPYQANEIINTLPDESKNNTALIFAISSKDMLKEKPRFTFGTKRNGEPSYMQPLPEDKKLIEPLTKHAYVDITPTVDFKVQGADANSASQIRQRYIKGNDADRDQIITDLYGTYYPELRDIFDQKLANRAVPSNNLKEHREKLTAKIMKIKEHLAVLRKPKIIEQQDYIDEKKH